MTTNEKVISIFRELIGERAERLKGSAVLGDSIDRVADALCDGRVDDASVLQSHEIAFHLMDWQNEAAFLTAVALFPERFTDEEIQYGVQGFLIHAPAHVLEAARQGGYEAKNIFVEGNES